MPELARPDSQPPRISTGCAGLDDVLNGGLPSRRLYLLEGMPGSGKTTLALQFLLTGAAAGEPVLYVSLSETREELECVAQSHLWDIGDIAVLELAAIQNLIAPEDELTLLHPWEVELGETVKTITDEVQRLDYRRVVFDSLSELRLLSQDPLRYRRQILGLKQFFTGRDCTVLLLDDLTAGQTREMQLHSIAHGVVTLERIALDFGIARRRLQVQKLRGVSFREGWHDYAIHTGGVRVFPRLVSSEHRGGKPKGWLASGIDALDQMLGGGPMRGTSTLVIGPAGSGKTTLTLQFLSAAAGRGERGVLYEFDERVATLVTRSRALGLDFDTKLQEGSIRLEQVDPAEISPGEFTAHVREAVEVDKATIIVIDSLNGYLAAMQHEQQLMLQMHELLSYLSEREVTTFLINPQSGLVGTMTNSINISYIADTVILLRLFEASGRVLKSVSVLKNRSGFHDSAIRELTLDAENGFKIGEALTSYSGVLTGTPREFGSAEKRQSRNVE